MSLRKLICLMAIALGSSMAWSALAQAPATVTPSKTPSEATTDTAAKATTAPAPAAGGLKPMKEVLQGATALPGLLKLHQKDDKVWIELLPEQFNQLLFFSYNVPRSVGERGLYGGQMGGAYAVMFRKVGQQVQLIAKNTEFFAKQGSPQAQFVSESFSDSLLGSAPLVAARRRGHGHDAPLPRRGQGQARVLPPQAVSGGGVGGWRRRKARKNAKI